MSQRHKPRNRASTMPHFTGLMCRCDERHTIFIKYQGGEFVASVEPANRLNGTQTWDGILPRYYKSVNIAKASLGKLIQPGLIWVPIPSGEQKDIV